jgi:hypothetical protein
MSVIHASGFVTPPLGAALLACEEVIFDCLTLEKRFGILDFAPRVTLSSVGGHFSRGS